MDNAFPWLLLFTPSCSKSAECSADSCVCGVVVGRHQLLFTAKLPGDSRSLKLRADAADSGQKHACHQQHMHFILSLQEMLLRWVACTSLQTCSVPHARRTTGAI
jgi:hypothetical protein